MANIAAKMGAIYRNETAVPMGKYLVDMKNKVIEVTPTRPLKTNNFFWFPRSGMLFFIKNQNVKNNELSDLKKTI
ncbi:hypothetical protein GCM10023330_14120 [Litoribaculum gwangyangense]|uniref:Uncharacterized protein n=1 Tax=Litoribaculum gwangyangense TaxID=1130722 RepID=A0ABP9CHZ7_9FLAO